MKVNKKLFFKIHSWIGVKLNILFFIVCFSGTMATLSNEMDWLFFPGLRASGVGERVSYNTIVKSIEKTYPSGKLTYWVIAEEPYLNDIVYVEEGGFRKYVFVDPMTGKITGSTPVTFQRFFRDFHYYLFMPFYQIGYFIVLTFSFLLLLAWVSALVFYKKWWQKFRELKRGKNILVFFRSLHRVVGLWSLPFAFLITVTGIWYFLERTNTGGISDISNPKAPKIESPGDSLVDHDQFQFQLDYELAAQMAQKEIPNLKIGGIVPGKTPNDPIYIRGKSDVPLVRKRSNRVYVDPFEKKVVGVQKAKEISTVMYLNDIADPIHFGKWGGLATKILWFLGGASICGLILTGIWIALKRQAIQKSMVNIKPVMGTWRFVNWGLGMLIAGYMYYFLIMRYGVSWESIVVVSGALGFLIFVTWFVFDFKLRRVVNEDLKKSSKKLQSA
ncbi:PepSY domain-containing protein [Algoriphagus sp. PAP.12]|uniref:PepSY domain-containing protein n=1 Tax=Algoriphagus sp. PAP.12 TaxID=2996678 RepID=UPI00227AA1AE|nr:PepSY domain-containing protein [Algoriphagus sp. PAP.12]